MDWLGLYSSALEKRDEKEHLHKSCTDAYTALADRAAHSWAQPVEVAQPSLDDDVPAKDHASSTAGRGRRVASPEPLQADALASLRTDLASTQKARSSLQMQLTDTIAQLDALSVQQRLSQQHLTVLTKQKQDVDRKLRDRDEELRGKSKLVEQAHDEMAALGLQLNLSEQRSEKLERENKELVERWMRRMGEEAERVNRDSKWV